MKKMYSFLLLSTLFLLGASNIWATSTPDPGKKIYVKNHTNGLSGTCWKIESGELYAYFYGSTSTTEEDHVWVQATTLTMGEWNKEGSIMEFTIPEVKTGSGNWTSVIIVRGTSPTFEKSSGFWNKSFDIPLNTTDFDNKNYLSDFYKYEEGQTASYTWSHLNTYSASFTNPDSWETVAAYTYSGEVKHLGGWPGRVVSGSEYSLTFLADAAPAVIIWNNNNRDNQSSDLEFHNGVTYTKDGETWTYYYPLTITSAGWASLYLDFAAEIPDGVTAYYANSDNISGSNVTLTPIETGYIIPANTGVVVKGDEGTYNFAPSNETPVTVSNNILTGTTVAESTPSGAYVLSGNETTSSNCVFAPFSGNNLAANKAYIDATSLPSSGAPSIHFIIEENNDATSLENLNSSENARKLFENGRLLILRDGITYDALGRIVK